MLKFTRTQSECLEGPPDLYDDVFLLCVRPGIMSNSLENNVALSEVGSKELCTCTKGCMAGLKDMFSLGLIYWALRNESPVSDWLA